MPLTDVNDMLSGSSFPEAIKASETFATVGSTIALTVTGGEKVQQRDITTKEPKYYADSGQPMMMLAIFGTVDGVERTLYAKGQMLNAIREAVKASGADGLKEGGVLKVRFDHEEDTGKPSKLKVFVAKYEPPTQTVDVDDF